MAGQSTFRRLWQPPGRYEDRATDRRVTILELYRTAEFALPVCALLCLAVGLTDWGAEVDSLRHGGAAPRPGGGGHGRVAQARGAGHARSG